VRGLVLERIALSCRATDDRPQHVRNPHPAIRGRVDRAPRSVSARSSQLSCLEVPFAAPDQAPRLSGRKGFDSLARCCSAWCCTKRDDGRFAAACGAEQIPPLVIGRFHSISRWNDRSLKKEIRIRHPHQTCLWPKLPDRAELEHCDVPRSWRCSPASVADEASATPAQLERRRGAEHIYYSLSNIHLLPLVESVIEHAAERRTTAGFPMN
jgi:hypothetical protein